MPKMTAKYSAALSAAYLCNLATDGDQEALYQRLQEAGLMWDSEKKLWIDLVNEPADPPSPLVLIRVWADGKVVEAAADVTIEAFERAGYELVEKSLPYVCRPPKQLESRVYLKLMPPGRGR